MKLKWSDTIKRSLRFSIEPKRWGPLFIADVIFIALMLNHLLANLETLVSFLALTTTGIANILFLIGYVAPVIVGFIIWTLIRLWIMGAIIHQSHKEREFRDSWKVSCRKYPSLILVVVIIGILAGLLGSIPYIGFILSILVSLAFFFALQAVIVGKHGFYKALVDSWLIFKKRPFKVFLIWLLLAIISLLIVALFSIPLMIVVWNLFTTLMMTASLSAASTVALVTLISLLQSYMPVLVATGVILLIGISISKAFALKAQTEFYLQIKKKRFGLF